MEVPIHSNLKVRHIHKFTVKVSARYDFMVAEFTREKIARTNKQTDKN